MSVVKQVKVDNWGIYFLQRLKHFFNRTDYCDLTLQFQDNAQLKVHRLVLSACTEYFELLERTCEMYEDRLVMPDDLQADVVVPIVNFMYTGQLEFKMDLLEKLYQTSLVMNMPVLSKLLDAHRQNLPTVPRPGPAHSYGKNSKPDLFKKKTVAPSTSLSGGTYKRTYTSAFETVNEPKPKRSQVITKVEPVTNGHQTVIEPYFPIVYEKNKHTDFEPRPTRYELPEELDEDNITDNSFSNISYNSKPLVVHPETVKQYGVKKPSLFEDPSSSKKFFRSSPNDIVECRKISMNSSIFDDGTETTLHEEEINQFKFLHREEHTKDASQLFDEIIEEGPKLTIETKDSKQVNNIDHAKIISEVLKKYPHLMKSNKNIKLKILDTPGKVKKSKTVLSQIKKETVSVKPEPETSDFTYQSDVIDSKEAARLIALGAENVHGPWICLICGTPGRALHFTTYYKFRRHLVEVHNEKPMPKICEYCGLKSLKRNYLLYHLFTKHGVPPPPNYSFPKCNYCNYVALTEALLVKHKMSHNEHKGFRCYVCTSSFGTSNQLLAHIQESGHKYGAERKANLQCIYCLKVFLREANLYTHLKTNHKKAAISDGIIENSDEESYAPRVRTDKMKQEIQIQKQCNESANVHDPLDDSYESIQYQLEQKEDGNIELVTKTVTTPKTQTKHKILNSGLESQSQIIQSSNTTPKNKVFYDNNQESNNFTEETEQPSSNSEEILLIDNSEYIIQNNQLIPKKEIANDEYIIPTSIAGNSQAAMPVIAAETLLEFQNTQNTQRHSSRMILKKSANINQPIQIVVSNEEEYKALMASNHSIIFDNSDPNKTLTVLTSQSCTSLETSTIDLQASQSNEMNIPDNYPISVSETITGDNSNIVVLYSHPIDDQNKHFHQQISQSIAAQYVQSSSIISQNFETVTTCSPVIGEHAVSTSIEQPWQQTLPVSTSQTTVTSIENITNTNLNELPEIQLATSKELPIEITQQSLVTTNEMGQTVDVYNQAEGIPISQSMIMTQNPMLITEEITTNNEGNINSEDENPETNSLNLLQQNIITSEIPEHSSVIVENSSQLDLSELTVVETLCEPTDSGSNNESDITANIEMIETQPVETEEVTEQVEIAQLEQEIPECSTNTPGYGQEIINPTEEVTEYIAETSELNVGLSEHTAEIIEPSQEITEPTEDTAEQTLQITEQHPEEVTEHIQEHSECTKEISETRKESITKHLTEISELESEIHIPEYPHKDEETKDTLTSINIQQGKGYQSINIPNDSVTVDVQHNLQSQEKSVLNNCEGNSHFIEVDGTENQIVEKVQSDNEDETNISEENMETGNENAPQINSCITSEPVSSKNINKPEIENLTSEWSEDDSDSQPEKAITDSKEPEPSSEVEESIESIQEEINKHLATSAQKSCVGKEQKKDLDAVEIVVPANTALPNEKISSLLDDWDDNDTQEEDTTTDQPTEEKVASEKENSNQIEPVDKKSVSENINKDNVPKPDNIKSLVSDWDEEEEQEINN
ncbi:uncharacterized protein PF11_0213 [Aricia agestis]|uniref:uncharacterized protein PF11_0213 n=1 Tax=Aricia agestis TaxID=91739 RepID=UPI001C209073|nr:uncharacterized protein PF11_0213 [Aricia agestis]XP_041980942.1 uncharacterized protein PF11_0213 [Aricia agestis]